MPEVTYDRDFDVLRHCKVDPGLINPSHYSGVPSKSGLNPTTKRGHPPIKINQGFMNRGFLNRGLTLRFAVAVQKFHVGWAFEGRGRISAAQGRGLGQAACLSRQVFYSFS